LTHDDVESAENDDRWMDLYWQALAEQDRDKVMALIHRANELIRESEQRRKKARKPRRAAGPIFPVETKRADERS